MSILLDQAHLAGPFGRRALTHAVAELGVRETSPNRGPRVDQYLAGIGATRPDLLCGLRSAGKPCGHCTDKPTPECIGSQWCGRFAKWDFDRVDPLILAGWGSLASALKWRDQAKNRRCWIETPSPGRVGLHLDAGGHGHVTLVALIVGDVITTVAGNEGNEVGVRQRAPSYFNGGFVELG